MNKSRLLGAVCLLFTFISCNSNAALIGPDYPPPGGVTWNGSGSGTSGTETGVTRVSMQAPLMSFISG